MYKVGDVVIVRKRNLSADCCTNGVFWHPAMDKYIGQSFVVHKKLSYRRVTLLGAEKDYGGYWTFDEGWLDPAYDENEELDCGDFTALISNI